MKKIKLTQNKEAIVDDECYDGLAKYKWHARNCNGIYYAVRKQLVNGKQKTIYMHRQILGHIPKGCCTDHINRNSLDNRTTNLKICTQAENLKNRQKLQRNNTTGILGVYWCKANKKWMASIRINRKAAYLGYYSSITDAAAARKQKEKELEMSLLETQ